MKVKLKQSSGLGRYGTVVDIDRDLATQLIKQGKAEGVHTPKPKAPPATAPAKPAQATAPASAPPPPATGAATAKPSTKPTTKETP